MLSFSDRVTMDSPRLTADGYMVATVRCARTGCQDYMASELGLDRPGVVTVYRPESAVFAKDSLASFAGKPITLNHPPVMVTSDNWKDYAAGEVGSEIARDGEFVVVPMKLMDAAVIRAVQDGTREISMGYTTPMSVEDGVAPDGTAYQAIQTGPIRINHLAVVPAARGGAMLRIGDSQNASWGASPINDRKAPTMPEGIKTRTVIIDGLSVETTDAGAQALEKLTRTISDMKAEMTAAEKKAKEDADEKEKIIAKKDAEIDALAKDKLTDAALDARVAARADLLDKAKRVADGVETAGLSDADIRKAAVTKALGDAAVTGKSQAYIDARFDILVEDADKADPVRGMKDAQGLKVVTSLDAVYAERNAGLETAWMKKGA